jgi:hypothetical protein
MSGDRVDLRTVEEFPTNVGGLPGFLIGYAEEVRSRVAAHIAHHDPAHVLREVAAKREIVNLYDRGHGESGYLDGWNDASERALYHLAAVYADHPDFQDEWTT